MPITYPSGSQPGAVSISPAQNRALYNDMNVILPQFERQLIGKYGNEMALLFELMGQTIVEARTKTRQFDHFERRRLRQYVTVNADVTGATAGTSITVTLKSTDHYASGAKSSIRVGEAGQISSTGVWFQISAVDKSSSGAHTATIKPVNSGDKLASKGQTSTLLASDILLLKGNVYAGERSGKMDGQSPIIDTISNTVTTVRDDYSITDKALAEEIKVGDQSFGWYYKLATTDLNKKLMHSIEEVVFEGRVADQAVGTDEVGTLGIIPKTLAGGGQIGYSNGSFGLTTMLEACRYLDFSGGTGTYMWLFDWNQGEEINRFLDGKYNTAVDSTGKDVQKYGFKGWQNEVYNFMFKRYRGFSPEASFGAFPTIAPHFRANFGILIPQKLNLDAETGKQVPSMQVVYQDIDGVKISTWETGGMAAQNKTDVAEKSLHALCYVGARAYAINQFAIVKAS